MFQFRGLDENKFGMEKEVTKLSLRLAALEQVRGSNDLLITTSTQLLHMTSQQILDKEEVIARMSDLLETTALHKKNL